MNRNKNEVARVYSGPLAEVERYHSALIEAGIESHVVGTELTGSFGSVLPESVELWVHRSDVPNAEAVIDRESGAVGAVTHEHFPHPISDPKPTTVPHWRPTYVNPNPGA